MQLVESQSMFSDMWLYWYDECINNAQIWNVQLAYQLAVPLFFPNRRLDYAWFSEMIYFEHTKHLLVQGILSFARLLRAWIDTYI
jgi:hypothetical protein